MKKSLSLLVLLFLFSGAYAKSPQFTFQDAVTKPGQIPWWSRLNVPFDYPEVRNGYVDFWPWVTVQETGNLLYVYDDDFFPCEYDDISQCRWIPEVWEDYLFFEKQLGNANLHKQVHIFWEKTRQHNQKIQYLDALIQKQHEKCTQEDSQECDNFFQMLETESPAFKKIPLIANLWGVKEYLVTSEEDKKVSIKIFPVTDTQYVYFPSWPDIMETYAFPIWTFVDPIYDYYRIEISWPQSLTYAGESIESYTDIPEYNEITQEIKNIALSNMSQKEKQEAFIKEQENLSVLFWEIRSVYKPSEITKKYMVTRFSPEKYSFPENTGYFLYNTAYAIVPYYETEISLKKWENHITLKYEWYAPKTGVITN